MTEQTVTADVEKKDVTDPDAELVPATQVVSIDREEEKTGQKMELPSPEVIANNAMGGYIRGMQELHKILTDKSVSKISVAKGVLYGLDLPEEELPVFLKTGAEKDIFGLVQQIVNCRFLVTQYHIDMRRKEMIAKQEAKEVQPTTDSVPEQTQPSEGVSTNV
jgi:hypothetical protein